MLGWIIQVTIVSIILILLVHHLINYFKTTFTVPKIKDLVNEPTQKYQEMYDIINNSNHSNHSNHNNHNNTKKSDEISNDDCTFIDSLPSDELMEEEPVKSDEVVDMKNELKNFLKSQIQV
jgi:hypothetical protein